MALPKKLFAQVADFAKMKGVRMNPEQTERALKKIIDLGPTEESKAIREEMVLGTKWTGLLEDPAVKRAYAVGSATTSKERPKDLDILIRGRGARSESNLLRQYNEAADGTLTDIFTPMPESFKSEESLLPYTGKARSKNILKEQTFEAEEYVSKYGSNHKWIRLVGIPAAIGLGLMSEEEVEAAFKPVEIAKTTAKLLKLNAQKIEGESLVKAIKPGTESLGPKGWQFVEGSERSSTAKRLAGVTESMLKIPQKEYSRITGVHVQPEIVIPGHASTKGVYVPQNAIPWRPSTSNKVFLSAMKVDKLTFPHEIAHGRQYNRPGTIRFLDDLQQHVKKWIKDPWEQYWSDPKEVHARGVAEAVDQVEGPLIQSIYDEIYNNELHKAIQYTEKWLQHLDPTFKARFLKNIAIGGAVMTALQLGPDEAEAGVLSAAKELTQKQLKHLFESTPGKKLLRNEVNPKRLFEKGFISEKVSPFFDETKGIYFAENRKGLDLLADITPEPHNVEAKILPGKKGFVRHYNPEMGVAQVVQTEAGQSIAKVKVDGRWMYRLLGTGGAVGATQLGGEDEASAMPRGVYQAIDYGAQLWRKTRDVTKLIGRTLSPGKVIDDVVVTGENERRIRFTDGTESIVDKSDIAKLYRSLGTRDYEAIQAIDKDPVSQMTRALKSLSFHEARYKQVPENQALQYVDDYLRNLSEMGEHISPDLVFVQRGDKVFTMPRAYAELLEEQDLLKILRSDKYIELLEKYKVK